MKIRVGYIQTDPIFGEKEKNFEQVRELTKNIQADLLVLPELFATGYTFTSKQETESLSETKEGETISFLKEISKKTGAVLVAGFAEKEGEKCYNSSIMVHQDKVIDVYRKVHLFNKEKLWFIPGNLPYKVSEVNGMKIGMMICFDWVFPEAVRTLALRGAQIIAHPVNLVLPYCQKAMTTRCIENRVFAITANRIGTEKRGEDNFTFTGASQITNTKGEILDSASTEKAHVSIVEIDLSDANIKKITDHNDVLRDRRPKFYEK